MVKTDNCPKEALRALTLHARTVKAFSELYNHPHTKGEYLYLEFFPELEKLLVDEIVSVLEVEEEREAFLEATGLDYLSMRVLLAAEELK